jgi:hypothetical protein
LAIDSGVVYRATQKWLQVALSKPNESEGWAQSTYSLVLLTNDTTYDGNCLFVCLFGLICLFGVYVFVS